MLQSVKWLILIGMVICIVWIVAKLLAQKQLKRTVVWCCISGFICFLVLSVAWDEAEPILPFNAYTLGASCVLGIPGVVLLMLTKILWKLS